MVARKSARNVPAGSADAPNPATATFPIVGIASESITDNPELFPVISRKWKYYRASHSGVATHYAVTQAAPTLNREVGVKTNGGFSRVSFSVRLLPEPMVAAGGREHLLLASERVKRSAGIALEIA